MSGFTFLEVLLSLAILGIGLAVILQGFALGARVRRDSLDRQRLIQAAGNRVNILLAGGEFPGGTQRGVEEEIAWIVEEIDEKEAPAMENKQNLKFLKITVTAPTGRTWSVDTAMPGPAGP